MLYVYLLFTTALWNRGERKKTYDLLEFIYDSRVSSLCVHELLIVMS